MLCLGTRFLRMPGSVKDMGYSDLDPYPDPTFQLVSDPDPAKGPTRIFLIFLT